MNLNQIRRDEMVKCFLTEQKEDLAHKFASHTVFHTEVKVIFGLKRVVQGDNERVVAA